jgi:CDP-diacylglycerol--glycerol-3-phosphate 3-phosphatidyltransferase
MKALPNILTSARLVLALFMFVALAAAAGSLPVISNSLDEDTQFGLQKWAVVAFVVAAVTDFFDGWLARRMNATSVWGAILDPIGDKVLVCGAIVGLLATGAEKAIVLPGGLILFREFTVSALREVGAGRGVKLPVTLLAKWKTTIQLVALTLEMILASWGAWGLPPESADAFAMVAHGMLWLAAVITLITGAQYWEQTRKSLST